MLTIPPPKQTRLKQLLSEQSIIAICVISVIFLSLLHFGQPASINLDPSWTAGLGYAFEHNLQAGVDYVFTFAPLGYYQHPNASYLPSIFGWFLVWKIIAAFVIALLIYSAFYLIPSNIDKFLYLTLFLAVAGWHLEAMYFITLSISFIFAIRLLEKPILTWQIYLRLTAILLFFIIISLGKFTFFMWMGGAIIALIFMAAWQHSWRVAVLLGLTHSILFAICWLALGQELTNIPAFIVNSLEIASGYSEAMTILYLPTQLFYAAMVFGTTLILMALNFWDRPFKLSTFLISGVILLTLFLAFKGAFVRQGLHILIFFPTAMVIIFLVGYETDKPKSIRLIQRFLRYAIVYFAFYGALVTGGFGIPYSAENVLGAWNKRLVSNTYKLFHLSEVRKGYENQWVALKNQYDLPEIRKVVRQSTVDIFSWEQTIIFLNNFNWHPRPVFQSYTVYTKKLIEINKHFFLTQPPEFVILKLQAIDFQFPLANDADSYKILLQHYRPVLEEKGYLLLKHRPDLQQDSSAQQVVLKKSIKEGEWLEIGQFTQQPLLLTLDIHKSWLGKIWVLLYRLPEIHLETRTTTGVVLKHRLIPRMAETGFMYNPLILTQKDFVDWYAHQPLQQVQALRIVINPVWIQRLFYSEFEAKLTEF